uniref:Alpha-gliadin n=1 Tax=Elymus ciliaris TaxID=129743 RepID=B9VSJ1_9POAL|nr:alpha-gliadin [Elymus ciliaris]
MAATTISITTAISAAATISAAAAISTTTTISIATTKFPPQQPYPQPQQQYPQSQQTISQQQPQQGQQIIQPFLQQQLIPCRDVVLQQRNIAHAWSQVLQPSSY